MNDQQRIEMAADNCEVLRARLARYEDADGNPITTIAEQAREIERLRMQLVACGVVALANTPESAAKARDMHPDYMSASCGDVIRTVDIQMQLRAELAELKAQPGRVVMPDSEHMQDMIDRLCDSASKEDAVFGWHECLEFVARLNSSPASAGDDRETIRAVFLRNGFTIKEGQADLKPYVYAAADELMSIARAALSAPSHAQYAGEVVAYWSDFSMVSVRFGDRVRTYVESCAPNHGEQVRHMVPAGWKLVPVEPTREMISAAEEAHMPFGDMDIALRCALFAAPSAGSHKEQGE